MSTETDRLGERVANIEGTIEQMDKRVDDLGTRMDERFTTLEDRVQIVDESVDELRRDFRRWIAVGATVIIAALTIVQVLL